MQDFTKGNITKQILLFSLPMLIGNVFQQLYSMVDAMVVGRYVGGGALGAVGASMPLINFLVGALIGLTTGASVVISQFYGAKEEVQLKRSVSTSAVFLAGLSVVIAAIGVLFTPIFLRWLSTPEDIFDMAVGYLRICLGGMLFPIFYNMYTAYMRALGDSKSPLYILIFSTILNIALDLWFVAGLGWGVDGAAWATILSQAVSCVACVLYANRYVPILKIQKLIFDRKLFGSILRYSIPAAMQISLTSLASLTIMRLVNFFGSLATAGYTAALKLDQFALMPLQNISMATSTFVGQNMGAGQPDRAKRGFRASMLFMIGIGLFVSLFVILFGKGLIGIFVDKADVDTGTIISIGNDYLTVIALFYTLHAIFFAFNGFFRGVGDAVIVMALTIVSLTIRAVFSYLLVSNFDMGPEAVAWSIPIGWGLCSLFAWFYYHKGFWKGKVAVKLPMEDAPEE